MHTNPRLLKGDLDNIVLMALRKETDRRYASVEDLSADIERYLNNLPVKARPNTFSYRASKFYTRNKTASIVGLFLALSLIFGIIATSWQAYLANQQRDRAEKRFQDVRKLSNSLLFEITPKIEKLEGSTEAREILVKRALEYLDSLSIESATDLTLQSELASAYEKVGDVQGNPGKANLGDIEGGIESFNKANKIRLALAEKNPDDFETQRLLATNYNSIGDFRWWASDVEGALNGYNKSIELFEKLVAQKPDDLPLNLSLISSNMNKIKVISYNGGYDEALKLHHELLQKIANLETKFQTNPELSRNKALTLIRIGYDLSWQNRYDILDTFVKNSFEIYESLAAASPNDISLRRELNFAYFQASGIYVETNPPLARQYIEKAINISNKMVASDKFNYLAKFDLAQGYSKLGEILSMEKRYPEAVANITLAEKILIELTVSDPKHEGYQFSLANTYARLATAQEGEKDYLKAVKTYQKSIQKHEELRLLDPKNNMSIRAIAITTQDLGKVFEIIKNPTEAINSYQKSVETFRLLEQNNALSQYDKKYFETVKKSLEELQKK